jgi:hypothetical protein
LERPWFAAHGRKVAWLAPALATAALVSCVARFSALDLGPIEEGPHRSESMAMFEYIADHTAGDDVIVFAKPRALALFTGRRAAIFHRTDDDRRLWYFFDRIHATYIVAFANDRPLADDEERSMAEFLRDFIDRNGPRLESVYANADFRVYKIHPATHAQSAGEGPPSARLRFDRKITSSSPPSPLAGEGRARARKQRSCFSIAPESNQCFWAAVRRERYSPGPSLRIAR